MAYSLLKGDRVEHSALFGQVMLMRGDMFDIRAGHTDTSRRLLPTQIWLRLLRAASNLEEEYISTSTELQIVFLVVTTDFNFHIYDFVQSSVHRISEII